MWIHYFPLSLDHVILVILLKYIQKHICRTLKYLLPDNSMLFCRASDQGSAKSMRMSCMFLMTKYTYAFYKPGKQSFEPKCMIFCLEFKVLMQSAVLNCAVQSLLPRKSPLVLQVNFCILSPTFNFHTSSSRN